jgi:anti-anti-sigma factor
VVRVVCHGSVAAQTAGELKDVVKPLIKEGGRIVLDFGDVSIVDSLGLGTLVTLKVSAVGHRYCRLEFEHLSERVRDLLQLTKLTELFAS